MAEHPVPASTSADNIHHNNNEIEGELSSPESRLPSLLEPGNLEVAEDMSRTILAVSQGIWPKDSPRVLRRKMNLAGILQMRSKFEEAEILQAEILTEMETSLGKDHRLTVQCTLNQAETFASRGRTEEAVSLLQNTLNTLSIDHEQLTAVKLLALDRLADAKTQFVEVMNFQRVSLRPMNPGQYQEAETQLPELVKCHNEIHGKEHLETFKCKSEIATLYKDIGRYEEAEELQESAINGLNDTAGEDHLESIDAKNSMILLYIALGRYSDAVALGETLAKRTENILGAQHPSSLDSIQNLALAYNHQGRFQDAERLEERVLEGWTARLGDSHPNAITARRNLALTRFDLGKKDEAMKLVAHGQDNVSIFPPNSDPATLQRLLNFAGALSDDGSHDEAIAIAECVFARRKKMFENNHPETLLAMSNLAMAHHKNHDDENALELLTESTSMGK
ncbi:Nephrocystin-3 [Fusarium beomiforme]|uniref:Nephrocystin-3 n=1 Tax=Fusarium beomiforme TaxID=44412 RepID=A0A9P5A5R7_9HYPO|nr:Nephrocystin-3 [Fusarium beomiforme]